MLRLLDGPTPITNENGDAPSGGVIHAYYPEVGIVAVMAFPGDARGSIYVITLDGVGARLAQTLYLPGGNGGQLSWWPVQKRLVTWHALGAEWAYEPKTFMIKEPQNPATSWWNPQYGASLAFAFRPYVKFSGWWLLSGGGTTLYEYKMVNGVGVGPPFGPLWAFNVAELRCGRNDFEVCGVGSLGGTACAQFFNVQTKLFTSPIYYFGASPSRVMYAPEWGVFVTSHDSETIDTPSGPVVRPAIRIWSTEVFPVNLSDPLVSIGAVKSGQVVTYQTRLTGAQNDPAENELINWSLSGVGELMDLQTTTNADGYATARVRYGLGDMGMSTIEASVTC